MKSRPTETGGCTIRTRSAGIRGKIPRAAATGVAWSAMDTPASPKIPEHADAGAQRGRDRSGMVGDGHAGEPEDPRARGGGARASQLGAADLRLQRPLRVLP